MFSRWFFGASHFAPSYWPAGGAPRPRAGPRHLESTADVQPGRLDPEFTTAAVAARSPIDPDFTRSEDR
jgi:hypothetical protein